MAELKTACLFFGAFLEFPDCVNAIPDLETETSGKIIFSQTKNS